MRKFGLSVLALIISVAVVGANQATAKGLDEVRSMEVDVVESYRWEKSSKRPDSEIDFGQLPGGYGAPGIDFSRLVERAFTGTNISFSADGDPDSVFHLNVTGTALFATYTGNVIYAGARISGSWNITIDGDPIAEAEFSGGKGPPGLLRTYTPEIPFREALSGSKNSFASSLMVFVAESFGYEPLIVLLDDPVFGKHATHQVGLKGDEGAVEPLIKWLQIIDDPGAIADALVRLGDRRAVEPLARVLSDPSRPYSPEVLKALGSLGGVDSIEAVTGFLLQPLETDTETVDAVRVLSKLGPDGFQAILAIVNSDKFIEVRIDPFVRGLEDSNDPRKVQLLVQFLDTEAWPFAVGQLRDLKEERVILPLIRLLRRHDGDPRVVHALKEITEKDYGSDATRWETWWSVVAERFPAQLGD